MGGPRLGSGDREARIGSLVRLMGREDCVRGFLSGRGLPVPAHCEDCDSPARECGRVEKNDPAPSKLIQPEGNRMGKDDAGRE